MPEAALQRPLVVVTGKGGVGKSTVAAALGLRAAASGQRTVIAEVGERDDVARMLAPTHVDDAEVRPTPLVEREVAPGLSHVTITPRAALAEYLRDQLPFGALAGALASSRAFTALTAATPGMSELLTCGKVWELAQRQRRTPGARPYDRVILDAPATGHGLALLEAPRSFAEMARVGPVARQGRRIADDLADPGRVSMVVVTTPERLAVGETLELHEALPRRLGLTPALTVANGLLPDRFSAADLAALDETVSADPAVAVARLHGRRAHEQQRQLQRLRRAVTGPVRTLPFRADPRLGREQLAELAPRIAR